MRMPGLPRPRPGHFPRIPGPWCWCANARCMSRGVRLQPPPPPPAVQICVKRGDRYAPVNTVGLDLGDHMASLTPPGGKPLIVATPMVTKATYDKARGGLILVPSALGASNSATPTARAGAPRG